jgi:hypothetical protein
VLAAALTAAAAAPAAPRAEIAGGSAAIFYYPWYGTPKRDGGWQHWNQSGHGPPSTIGAAYYPSRGTYSSSDPELVRAHMREIAATGIDTVIVSWWGAGSTEDTRLPLVIESARESGLHVAVHVEPYRGRTPADVAIQVRRLQEHGVRDFYVYDSAASPDSEWAAATRSLRGVRLFANTSLVGKARAGGFHGLYTYDVLVNTGSSFPRLCAQARAAGLLCAPSVGPGFDAFKATGEHRKRDRRDGAVYDQMWRQALRSQPDIVTVTSYNEWHEGTQIEPAQAAGGSYLSYEGAYGLRGASAEHAYLARTDYWVERFQSVEVVLSTSP